MSMQSSWNSDSLKQYLDEVLRLHDERYLERFTEFQRTIIASIRTLENAATTATLTAEQAVKKADEVTNRRFDDIKGFKDDMLREQRSYITRGEVETQLSAIREDIEQLVEQGNRHSGLLSATTTATSSWPVIGIIGWIAAAALLMKLLLGFSVGVAPGLTF